MVGPDESSTCFVDGRPGTDQSHETSATRENDEGGILEGPYWKNRGGDPGGNGVSGYQAVHVQEIEEIEETGDHQHHEGGSPDFEN